MRHLRLGVLSGALVFFLALAPAMTLAPAAHAGANANSGDSKSAPQKPNDDKGTPSDPHGGAPDNQDYVVGEMLC